MGTDLSSRRILFGIIVITLVGFIIWIGFLFVVWQLIQRASGGEVDFWVMAEALSTALGVAALFGAGFVAYHELNEAADSRHMEVADRLFQELNSPESIDARRRVYQNLPDDPETGISSLSDKDRAALKRVLNSLDRVAFLTQTGWIPDDMVMPWMSPMIVKVWAKVQAYVDFESARRQEPEYYEHARVLAARCVAWRKKNLPDSEIKWIKDAL